MKTPAKTLRHAKILDKVSGVFFFIGFVFSKLQSIPLVFLSALFNLLSLISYLTAYSLWLAACERYPDHPSPKSWYSSIQLKNQHRFAAVFGTLAIMSCLVAIIFPIALIPAAWCFLISNIVWCVAEYHKMRHPPVYDPEYSSERQAVYMRYALLMTSASLITALATTLVLCFPPITMATLITATIVCLLINLAALQDWVKFTWADYPPDMLPHSHTAILDGLGSEPDFKPDFESDSEPEYRPTQTISSSSSLTPSPLAAGPREEYASNLHCP